MIKLNDEVNGYKVVGISKDNILLLKDGKYDNVAPDKVQEFTKPTKKKPLKEATRDGDGDGFINGGKPNVRKVTAKKEAS